MFPWIPTSPVLRSLIPFVFCGVVIAGYVLSPFPVMSVCEMTGLDQVDGFEQVVCVAWYPLEFLYENVPAVEAFYGFYGDAYDRVLDAVTRND